MPSQNKSLGMRYITERNSTKKPTEMKKQRIIKFIFLIAVISIILITAYNLLLGNWKHVFFDTKFKGNTSAANRYKSPNAVYQRDSLFIVLTIKQFLDEGVYPFDLFQEKNIPTEMVHFEVDSIIYSPDKLKFFAFLIEHAPESNTVSSNRPVYYFSELTLIGYRNSINEIWKIYCDYTSSVFETYNDNRNFFRRYYFGEGNFKFDSEYYWDSSLKERVLITFKYNLDDTRFWDSSIVWKKGSRVPGYYGFETNGNVKPNDENAIKEMPDLKNSDSLLRLYK